ncbi:MAG: tetratricopeptide repeat protein, partial [Candidatus Binatia bacterium]
EQYSEQGRFDEAAPLYQESLSIAERGAAAAPLAPDYILYRFALSYHKQKKHLQAQALLKRALAIRDASPARDSLATAQILAALGATQSNLGHYRDAESTLKRALQIEEAAGANRAKAAEALLNLATLYRIQSRYAEAEQLLRRSLQIREKISGPADSEAVRTLMTLANLHRDQGNYAAAEALFRRALNLRAATLGEEHPDVASSLVAVGIVKNDQRQPAEALELCRRAAAIADKLRGAAVSAGAEAWTCIAAAYLQQNKFEESEAAFKRSIQTLRPLSVERPVELALALNGLGELYRSAGKFADAEAPLRESLELTGHAAGQDSTDYAMALNNLGLLYKDEGRYPESEPLHRQSLAIVEKAVGSDHVRATYPLNALASLYMAQKKFRDAEPLLRRALGIRESVYGLESPAVATLVNNLAAVYAGLGRFADAEPLYRRALTLDEKTLGPEHPTVAIDAGNLGRTYIQLNRPAEAEALLQRALRIAERSLGPDHPAIIYPLRNLGLFYYGRNDYARAEPLYERALQALEKQFAYQFSYMSEKDRLSFLSTVEDTFSIYLSFCYRFQGRQPAIAGKMYDLALWHKGLVARSISSLRRQIAASGDPQSTSFLDQLGARKTRLAGLQTAQLTQSEQSREDILNLQREINELETQLVRRSAAYAERERLAGVKWRDVITQLQPDEAAVEFLRFDFRDEKWWTGESYYVAIVLSRASSAGPQVVWLGEATSIEGEALRDYRALVQATAPPPEKTGTSFYQAVWRPLEPFLAGIKRVYLSPDGIFNNVSWVVVPTSPGQLLGERYEIHLLLSTRDLTRPASKATNRMAALFGDPDFDLSEDRQRAAARRAPGRAGGAAAGDAGDAPVVRSGVRRSAPLDPLPGTQRELESIHSQLERHGWQTTIYTGPDAIEDNVKAIRSPRLLHFATHGFFAPDAARAHAESPESPAALTEEPMLRSMLYFAGANRVLKGRTTAAGIDDGVLTAYEASELNLRGTELVVLSACETGLGVTRNAEGVFGLRRALQEAGADAVLMSLWKVPDRDTQELITLFYQMWLSGATKQAALRKAQLEMRERVRSRREGNDIPYYWGAFVLVGR